MLIQEEQGRQRLVLPGGGYVLFDGQVRQEMVDVGLGQVARMAAIVW